MFLIYAKVNFIYFFEYMKVIEMHYSLHTYTHENRTQNKEDNNHKTAQQIRQTSEKVTSVVH